MPMKKNLIYLLVLLVLATVGYFLLNSKNDRLFPIEDANFQVENVQEVTKIFLSDKSRDNIKLTKGADGVWMVNDSFRARQDWVAFLLDGLEKQNPAQMVPKSMHNSAIKLLAGGSIKCEVYKGDKKTNAFYVARQPDKNNTAIMLNIREDGSNAPRPFIVKYGLTDNFLGVRYQTDLENWRDKQILYFPKSEIVKISVSYPKKTAENFTLLTKPSYKVLPEKTGLNADRAKAYHGFYDKLFCMGFENDYILKDTFVRTFKPFAMVEVTSAENKKQDLKIFYRQVHKGTHQILTVDGQEYDGDTFFGWLNKRDFVLLSSQTVQKMLREYHEFYESPSKLTTSED